MSDNNTQPTLRELALEAHAQRTATQQQEEAVKAAEQLAKNRTDSYYALSARLKDLMGITEGFSVEHPDFEDAYAVLDDLPGFRFFAASIAPVGHPYSAYDRLRVEADLPEHPSTTEYEEWWENPENKQVSYLSSAVIKSMADLGRFLADREAAAPLTIKPWPGGSMSASEPAEPAVDPAPRSRIATLRTNEANTETRPYRVINALVVDGSVRVVVEYTDL